MVASAWAQNEPDSGNVAGQTESATSNQQSATSDSQSSPQTPPYVLNVPIVGLNLPLKVIGGETRSFLLPGAQLSGGLNSEAQNGFGPSDTSGTVRGLGSLSFQRLWKRYDFGADYLGGVAYLGNRSLDRAILQSFHADQRISWNTGQFVIRDLFSYLPDGNFLNSAYGGGATLSGLNGGLGGGVGGWIFGPNQFASLGEQPRITNEVLSDVTQYLSPRSSIALAGSYGLVHFTEGNFSLINSSQVAAQASYDYQLSRRNQLAVLYAHQSIHYPSAIGDDIDSNVFNVLFGHRINGRFEFIVGAGPQFTHIDSLFTGPVDRVTASGRVFLKYQLKRTDISAAYLRYTTNGSGFFPGATTDVVRLGADRALGRLWGVQFSLGYNSNSRLTPGSTVGAPKNFDYVYVGTGAHRQLSRELSAFASFQFTNTNFNAPFCLTPTSCGRTSQREVFLFGVDWHPHPIRID